MISFILERICSKESCLASTQPIMISRWKVSSPRLRLLEFLEHAHGRRGAMPLLIGHGRSSAIGYWSWLELCYWSISYGERFAIGFCS